MLQMATTISIRFEDEFLHSIEAVMKGHHYSTKAEFIREAIRDKVKDLETEEALMRLDKISGSSKRLTTTEQMRKAKKEAFEALASKYA